VVEDVADHGDAGLNGGAGFCRERDLVAGAVSPEVPDRAAIEPGRREEGRHDQAGLVD
jgi:hypothetical protein